MYDAISGRFVSRDPLGFVDGMNTYSSYICLSGTDPSGMDWLDNISDTLDPGGIWDDLLNSEPQSPPFTLGPRPQSGPNARCPSTAEIFARIGMIQRQFIPTLIDAGVPTRYPSMPFQHCVWNCRMTMRLGEEEAERLSLNKENADLAICNLGRYLSNRCFARLGPVAKKFLVGSCCSAFQPADFADNATGRSCGKTTICRLPRAGNAGLDLTCEDCCRSNGVNEETCDGPGTSRPCGPFMPARWEHLNGCRYPQDF